MGEGVKADSLVLDIPMFMNNLQNTTHIRFDTQFELINVGIKLENMYLTFAITEKVKYGLSLPYDFFEFALNGNRPYMLEDKPLDFSGFGVNLTHYREFAVGGSMNANDKLTVGGRVKLLFGQANFNTEIKELSLYTNPDNYSMTWTTDMKIHSSLPVYFDYIVGDSINLNINQASLDNFNPLSYVLNMKNIGLGFDLGGSYKITPEIEVFGSLTDFGFISWNTNPQNFVSKGQYEFRGFEIEVWDGQDAIDQSVQNFKDTLLNTFNFELLETGYLTWLPSSLYLGGEYKLHKLLSVGALYRGEFYRKSYIQSFTLAANSNLTNWLSAHVSYSIANNYFGNLGFGLNARLGFVNWYFVTDNLTGMIWPQKARNVNIRMGCNLVFGYKKIKSNASQRM
jgi:hypothetical protein